MISSFFRFTFILPLLPFSSIFLRSSFPILFFICLSIYLSTHMYVCLPVDPSLFIFISILLFFLHFHSLSCLLFHSPFLLISFPSSSPLHSIRLIHSLHLHFPFTVCLKTYSIYIRMRMGSHRPTRGFEFISRNWYKLIQIYMHTSVYLSLCSYRQTAMCKGILN